MQRRAPNAYQQAFEHFLHDCRSAVLRSHREENEE